MATETRWKTTDQYSAHGFKASPVADAALYKCISPVLIAADYILVNNPQTSRWSNVASQIPPFRQRHGSEHGKLIVYCVCFCLHVHVPLFWPGPDSAPVLLHVFVCLNLSCDARSRLLLLPRIFLEIFLSPTVLIAGLEETLLLQCTGLIPNAQSNATMQSKGKGKHFVCSGTIPEWWNGVRRRVLVMVLRIRLISVNSLKDSSVSFAVSFLDATVSYLPCR